MVAAFVALGCGHRVGDRIGVRRVEALAQQGGLGGGMDLAERHLNGIEHGKGSR